MGYNLRRNLSRNMYLSNQNQAIDDEIERLRRMSAFDVDAQNKIYEPERQKTQNYQAMVSPMTEHEAQLYDDSGNYIGMPQNDNGGVLQTIQDGVSHTASGISQGFFDEANGVIGGAGRVMANVALRALGQPVNGESISDAWNKGYTEYRDYARQELADGAERNPGVSLTGEVVGSLASPVKVANTNQRWLFHPEKIVNAKKINALANGVISGIGYTDDEAASAEDYGWNILKGASTGYGGYKLSSNLSSNNIIDKIDRGISNATSYLGINHILPNTWADATNYFGNLFNNDEEEDEEEKRKRRLGLR